MGATEKTALRRAREVARVSQIAAAAKAGVSPPLVMRYETFGRESITDLNKRAALDEVYEAFDRIAGPRGRVA